MEKGLADLVFPEFDLADVSSIRFFHSGSLIDQFGHSGPSTPLHLIDINKLKDTTYLNTLRIGVGSFPGINLIRSELVKIGQTSEFKSSDVFAFWAWNPEDQTSSLGVHNSTCKLVNLGWYGTNPNDPLPERQFVETVNPSEELFQAKLTESLPQNFDYSTELLLPSQYFTTPHQNAKKVSEADLEYTETWNFPALFTTHTIPVIQHVICEIPQLNEGVEVGGFILGITNANGMPVAVSTTYSKVFFLVYDCEMSPSCFTGVPLAAQRTGFQLSLNQIGLDYTTEDVIRSTDTTDLFKPVYKRKSKDFGWTAGITYRTDKYIFRVKSGYFQNYFRNTEKESSPAVYWTTEIYNKNYGIYWGLGAAKTLYSGKRLFLNYGINLDGTIGVKDYIFIYINYFDANSDFLAKSDTKYNFPVTNTVSVSPSWSFNYFVYRNISVGMEYQYGLQFTRINGQLIYRKLITENAGMVITERNLDVIYKFRRFDFVQAMAINLNYNLNGKKQKH